MADPRFRVGTSGWSYPDWVGPRYYQGHGPATARALLAKVAGVVSES